MTDELTWDPPGPGMWFLAREHVPVPVSRLCFELLVHAASGWTESAERYGLPDGPARWGYAARHWMPTSTSSAGGASVATRSGGRR